MKKCQKSPRRALIIFVSIALLCVIFTSINILYSSNAITTSAYNLQTDEIATSLHFVFISDLHNKEFGKNNSRLIEKIKNESPDFIAVGGDMVTNNYADEKILKSTLTQLAEIAPTYCILGNHELYLANTMDFETIINSTGAELLDNEVIHFEKDNETIVIGGMSDFPFYEFNGPEYNVPERYFWDEFVKEAEEHYSILLHHQPEYLENLFADTKIDLVVCGHTHGGLIRIPFVGGVVSPNQALFPKYDMGEYQLHDTTMIISSGMSNSNFVPRINNPPEICVIDVN